MYGIDGNCQMRPPCKQERKPGAQLPAGGGPASGRRAAGRPERRVDGGPASPRRCRSRCRTGAGAGHGGEGASCVPTTDPARREGAGLASPRGSAPRAAMPLVPSPSRPGPPHGPRHAAPGVKKGEA
ncbi:neuropeptide Y receptor type 1 isoform X3 [Saccopteryx leptura]|uniref:neuropeptide Y receptor type 1 isoform X3 n=1 Tax=Saccopteryx leptura TaxID=249018 RepID=UPI00339CC258